MATIERKRVTLHPLKEDGTVDPKVCLYPKTFVDGIVDRNGDLIDIATQAELNDISTEVHLEEGRDTGAERILRQSLAN